MTGTAELPSQAPYGGDLGSLNLPRFVTAPFTPEARLDLEVLEATARA